MSRYETARRTEAHEFDLVIGRDLTSDELDAITHTGADDYLLGRVGTGNTLLCFTRAAPTLAEALTSALGDVISAGLGGDIADVRCFGMTGADASLVTTGDVHWFIDHDGQADDRNLGRES